MVVVDVVVVDVELEVEDELVDDALLLDESGRSASQITTAAIATTATAAAPITIHLPRPEAGGPGGGPPGALHTGIDGWLSGGKV